MPPVLLQRTKLGARLRRIRGQMDAVQRALDDQHAECTNILQLVAAARGGMNALMAELMADHLLHHIVEPGRGDDPHQAADELIAILKTYLR